MHNLSETTSLDKTSLRRKIRIARNKLSKQQRHNAARNLKRQLNKTQLTLRTKHVALYLANDGEIDPNLILKDLLKRKIHCYLPVIHPLNKNTMVFCRYRSNTKLRKNRFGIPEPSFKYCRKITANHLSLVLLPLVAFDERGNRMGMGGGFYDRMFAFKKQAPSLGPKMIGLAYELQKVPTLPVDSWDIPLTGIITEDAKYMANKPTA